MLLTWVGERGDGAAPRDEPGADDDCDGVAAVDARERVGDPVCSALSGRGQSQHRARVALELEVHFGEIRSNSSGKQHFSEQIKQVVQRPARVVDEWEHPDLATARSRRFSG